ncbi:L-threonylcarbamoyladenylate synthase [Halomonas sp. WWR20]
MSESRDTSLNSALVALRAGGIIAYPTEAVWGLGCDPDNDAALAALIRLKARDPAKGLILIAGDIAQLAPWLEGLEAPLYERLQARWPGPYTWLVPDNGRSRPLLRGEHDRLAVRVSDHPWVQRLCAGFGGPLVSTSANTAGQPPAMTAQEVSTVFGDGVAAVVDGPLGGRERPSTIRDLISGEIIRS